tara:strand:- start:6 stop:458 length:453 start_codon:yes stop_codon:yes gene_type:complete
MRMFAESVATGDSKTLTEAYGKIYGKNMTKRTQKNEASKLWNNPVVQDLAKDVRARVSAQRALRLTGDADAIRRKLWEEAENADRASDRISALKLLGQQRGVNLFAERLEISEPDHVSDAEVLVEIEQLVRSISNTKEVVELPDENEQIH